MGVYRIQRLLVTYLSLLQERLGGFILLLGDKLLCINCIDSIDCIDPIGMWEYISWILFHLFLLLIALILITPLSYTIRLFLSTMPSPNKDKSTGHTLCFLYRQCSMVFMLRTLTRLPGGDTFSDSVQPGHRGSLYK